MPGKRKKEKTKRENPEDRMKYEIAKELGLAEKVKKYGWGGLTTAETGRIGGLITMRKRAQKAAVDGNKSLEG